MLKGLCAAGLGAHRIISQTKTKSPRHISALSQEGVAGFRAASCCLNEPTERTKNQTQRTKRSGGACDDMLVREGLPHDHNLLCPPNTRRVIFISGSKCFSTAGETCGWTGADHIGARGSKQSAITGNMHTCTHTHARMHACTKHQPCLRSWAPSARIRTAPHTHARRDAQAQS